jgi:hypothetical protein
MKTLLAVLLLASSPALATPTICTTDTANNTLDKLRDNHGEVPILKMQIAGGIQGILVANPAGDFWLLVLSPSGTACILAIGDTMKQAKPDDRFHAETEE